MKRFVLFSFYDPDGIVDDYVIYLLKSFNGIADEILTIVNGSLTPESNERLKTLSNILMRENMGFDAWGYKEGFENYGYENLKKFDEIICLNHTCFGPIFPWEDMFEKMSQSDCDWWSLFKDHCPQNFVPGEHMPSYFIVIKNPCSPVPILKNFGILFHGFKTMKMMFVFMKTDRHLFLINTALNVRSLLIFQNLMADRIIGR